MNTTEKMGSYQPLSSEALWTPRFIILCIVNFLLFVSFFFLLPTLPVYLVDELQAREDQVGLLIGIFTIAAVIARPLTGYYMDRSVQKRVFLLSVCLFVLATAGYLWVQTLAFFMLIRFFHGFGFGMATTAGSTMAAEWIPAERRGEGLGYYGTFVMVAMSVGPIIGVYLVDQLSYSSFFTVCIAIAGLGMLLSLSLQPPQRLTNLQQQTSEQIQKTQQTLHSEQIKSNPWNQVSNLQADSQSSFINRKIAFFRQIIGNLFELKALPVSMCTMMIAIVFGGCITFISLYAIELGDAKMAGMYFSLYALALVITRPFAGRWFDRKGPFTIIMVGSGFYFIGVIVLGLANGAFMLYLAAIIIGVGYGSLQPSYQALVIQVSPENRRGAATATFFTTFDIGVGFGAFALGFVAHRIGYGPMFLVSSIFLIISLVLFYRFWKRNDGKENVKQNI